MLIYFVFIFLVFYTLFINKDIYFKKTTSNWILDLLNLSMQGTLIPFLQVITFFSILVTLFPKYQGSLDLNPVLAFLLNFVLIDYLYYLNHRLFHSKALWPLHKVHHTATQMDVFVTSRNTLWSSFLIIYLWINAAFVFLLDNPTFYILSMTITAALDLWRHSNFFHSKFQTFFSKYLFLITPIDHSWHHGEKGNLNYGANLNLFDKIHGTFEEHSNFPETLGIPTKLPFWKKLLFPFGKEVNK